MLVLTRSTTPSGLPQPQLTFMAFRTP
jgi:hypothetical protein